MPRRLTHTKKGTHDVLKHTSFEVTVVSWLMQDGWQVFLPMLDNGHKTDILISDGPNYFRIQIKTVEATGDSHLVENKWEGSDVDLIVFFARNSNWGVIAPAFTEKKRPLNHETHHKFEQTKKDFLRVFHGV
ncbi:hypothetical protein [Roseibacillus persicicus]|uniref:hypothetical protein n=1 Tax=Roseibacillus persicicus TaxID=454148 RepID=UPI00280E053E|nr:hypothetical protein [Roseibacillus persicicus]MDQ8190794.1 hypothetical protein [Roseibacillus persicicus]